MRRCLGCMEEYDERFNVCPHCGYIHGQIFENTLYIKPGTIIKSENNSYTIGKVLGSGSFGVTYLAWDNALERKVAIKEYMPSEHATRAEGISCVVIKDGKVEQFGKGIEKFIDEARKLAKFENEEGIVKIYDQFYANDTAYIVMEYLEGQTLADYLQTDSRNCKTIDPQTAVDMLMPVMMSLNAVHKAGIIHRDIAPDNIMLTKDGKVKLIDFGAARYATSSHSKSLSVLVKPGYSPEEQYRTRGEQGPHTDVYALAATLYKMITGVTPPEALDRRVFFEGKLSAIKDKKERKQKIKNAKLVPLRKYNKKISSVIENAIYNALNIKIEDRTPDIDSFIKELTAKKPAKIRDQSIKLIDRFGWKKWQIISTVTVSSLVVTMIILLATGVIHFTNPFQKKIVIPEGFTRVPSIVNQQLADAEKSLSENSLQYSIQGKEYSDTIPKDFVLTQSINPGTLAEINTMMYMKISGGIEQVEIPDVLGFEKEKAIELIKEAPLSVSVSEEYNNYISEGYVISQSLEGGVLTDKNSEIVLVVSKGKNPDEVVETKDVTIPNFVGMTYADVLKKSSELGIMIEVAERKYSDKYDKDVVMSQSVTAGNTISNETPVSIVISMGIKYVYVPDVVYFTESEAINKLTSVELIVNKRFEESETVAEGLVISQSTSGGEKLKSGSTIQIVISKGRGTFEMPSVNGASEKDAISTLRNKGLTVNCTYENSDTVASGLVISQSISSGTQIKAGTEITLVISSGEKLYKVPNVVGMRENDAKNALSSNKFNVSVSSIYDDNVESGKVISQTLAAGGQYKKGTTVAIVVSKGKEPFVVTFNGNGGSVSQDSLTIHYGDTYGSLPNATRTTYTFNGWYTAASGGVKVTNTSVYSLRTNQTLYAHWTENSWSSWSTDGNIDSSKYEIQTKTQYRYSDKTTTTSTSSSLSGYTQNGYTWSSYGSWSDWSESAVSSSDEVKVETKQETYTYETGRTLFRYHHYKYWNTSENRWYWTYSESGAWNYGHSVTLEYFGWSTTELFLTQNYGGVYGTKQSDITNLNGIWFCEETMPETATGTRTYYRYCTRYKIYNYYKWSSWSGWQDSSVTASSTRNVETRTLYRYRLK